MTVHPMPRRHEPEPVEDGETTYRMLRAYGVPPALSVKAARAMHPDWAELARPTLTRAPAESSLRQSDSAPAGMFMPPLGRNVEQGSLATALLGPHQHPGGAATQRPPQTPSLTPAAVMAKSRRGTAAAIVMIINIVLWAVEALLWVGSILTRILRKVFWSILMMTVGAISGFLLFISR